MDSTKKKPQSKPKQNAPANKKNNKDSKNNSKVSSSKENAKQQPLGNNSAASEKKQTLAKVQAKSSEFGKQAPKDSGNTKKHTPIVSSAPKDSIEEEMAELLGEDTLKPTRPQGTAGKPAEKTAKPANLTAIKVQGDNFQSKPIPGSTPPQTKKADTDSGGVNTETAEKTKKPKASADFDEPQSIINVDDGQPVPDLTFAQQVRIAQEMMNRQFDNDKEQDADEEDVGEDQDPDDDNDGQNVNKDVKEQVEDVSQHKQPKHRGYGRHHSKHRSAPDTDDNDLPEQQRSEGAQAGSEEQGENAPEKDGKETIEAEYNNEDPALEKEGDPDEVEDQRDREENGADEDGDRQMPQLEQGDDAQMEKKGDPDQEDVNGEQEVEYDDNAGQSQGNYLKRGREDM